MPSYIDVLEAVENAYTDDPQLKQLIKYKLTKKDAEYVEYQEVKPSPQLEILLPEGS